MINKWGGLGKDHTNQKIRNIRYINNNKNGKIISNLLSEKRI